MTVRQDTDSISPPIASLKALKAGVEATQESVAQAAAAEGAAAVKGMQAGARQWTGWARDSYQANLKACQALIECRSLHAMVIVQGNLMQAHMNLLVDNSHRITMATWKTALGARDTVLRPSHV